MGGGESHTMNTQAKWAGRFEQGGSWNEMHFNHMMLDQNGNINGNGSDAVGGFSLTGNMQGSQMQINKQYHGAHTVHYNGQMDNQGWVRGGWNIPGNCQGQFELKLDVPHWTGSYSQGGQKHPMSFGLAINGGDVYGNGVDGVGAFGCKGTYNQGSGQMTFTKFYYGQHQVQYRGQHHNQHGTQNIKGEWCIPGNSWDHFELKLHH